MVNKIVVYGVAGIVVLATLAGALIFLFTPQSPFGNVKVTLVVETAGEYFGAEVNVNQQNPMEMLTSFGAPIDSSQFKPMDISSGEFNQTFNKDEVLAKYATYKVAVLVSMTPRSSDVSGFGYSGIKSSWLEITGAAGGYPNGDLRTGVVLPIDDARIITESDWMKFNEESSTDGGGQFVYFSKASSQPDYGPIDNNFWKKITGEQINGMEINIKFGATFTDSTGTEHESDVYTAKLTINADDWLENHISLNVKSVNIEKRNA